jgi:adenosylcobinamide amidohydrolase
MPWEILLDRPAFVLRRHGRFLVAALKVPHRAITTSARNGGQVDHLRFLLNHQSCEGAAHLERHRAITESGLEVYHDRVCDEAGVPAPETAAMGTAANMNYAAVTSAGDEEIEVTAVVTAGVEGNATCAGDPAAWRETGAGIVRVPPYAGTINAMVLINRPLTAAALSRAVVTTTEGKSAALQRLSVPSRQSLELATGTGTDQLCLAAPLEGLPGVPGVPVLTSASTHMKLGELLGRAMRDATLEALRWQNGLEPSYTRGVFHALGRYGVKEATFFEDIAAYLEPPELELLRKNSKAALYEPLVGAAAHALATVFDRVRHGALPASVEREAGVQQAATLAASLAACPERWPEFRTRLHQRAGEGPKSLVLAALALGWSEKWR